jgi:hypothetical protein
MTRSRRSTVRQSTDKIREAPMSVPRVSLSRPPAPPATSASAYTGNVSLLNRQSGPNRAGKPTGEKVKTGSSRSKSTPQPSQSRTIPSSCEITRGSRSMFPDQAKFPVM